MGVTRAEKTDPLLLSKTYGWGGEGRRGLRPRWCIQKGKDSHKAPPGHGGRRKPWDQRTPKRTEIKDGSKAVYVDGRQPDKKPPTQMPSRCSRHQDCNKLQGTGNPGRTEGSEYKMKFGYRKLRE